MSNGASPQPGQSSPPGRPGVFDIQGFVRRYIPFATRFQGGFKSGMGEDVTFVFVSPNVDTAFTLALGKIPSRYVVHWRSVGGVVFNGSNQGSDWTATKIVLRATSAGTYHGTVF